MKPSAHNPTIVFFGTEQWGAPILTRLAESYAIAAVVTRPDSAAGRQRQITEPPIKLIAKILHLKVLQPEKLLDIKLELESLGADLGVLVAYGRLVPQEIIDLFPHGIINVHPSLLPKYRGPSPIENIILNHDQPGFSVIQLSQTMDAGDILSSKAIIAPNPDTSTAPQLYELSGLEGAKIMRGVVEKVFNHSIKPMPQSESEATYTKLIQKADGIIDWTKPANQIEAEIRAYAIWPGSRTNLTGTEVIITKSHLFNSSENSPTSTKPGAPFKTASGELAVTCGQGAIVIDTLKPTGKTEMTGRAFLAGHRLD